VDANPEWVNARDRSGHAPLFVAVFMLKSLPLTLWLLDEKSVDANVTTFRGVTSLHRARTPDIALALLDRGADPAQVDSRGWSPLKDQAYLATVETMGRLLQSSRIRATINMQDFSGITALHHACRYWDREDAPPKAPSASRF
jgi:ankyrin repeat protein